MTAQLGLFDAPPAPAAAKPAPVAPAARPTPPAAKPKADPTPKAKRKGAAPDAPLVVIDAPQLPPLGAVGRFDERWHRWGKLGVCGDGLGWSVIKPQHHAAHAKDTPPRLDGKGWIAEPYPAPATIYLEGVEFRVEWSEYGFSLLHGGKHFLHFSEVAGCAVAAGRIASADDHFQERLAPLVAAKHAERMADLAVETATAEAEAFAELAVSGDLDDDEVIEGAEPVLADDIEGDPIGDYDDDQDDDPAPVAARAASEPEPLEACLQPVADAGLLSTYSLGFGYAQNDPRHSERAAPWNEPSRLFKFPCTILRAEGDKPTRLLIPLALLADHPYVREVAALSGLVPQMPEAGPDAWKVGDLGRYHHAVDLVAAGKWERLLELLDYTDADAVISAVAYGLDYGHLSTRDAQTVLRAVGADLPQDGSPLDALRCVNLSEFADEKKKRRRTTNWLCGPGPLANVWGRIAGMERGWFVYDGKRHLTWTDKADGEQQAMRLAEAMKPTPDPDDCWRFEWRGLSVIGTPGPCFQIDRQRHPPGTLCWSETGFRSFTGAGQHYAGALDGRSEADWCRAILDAYLERDTKDGCGLGGQLVAWWPIGVRAEAPKAAQGALL